MHTIFWFEQLNGRDHTEFLGVGGSIILERILRKYGEKVWTGLIWLRVGTSGESL
jgi:hypothetical protein